ncbi:2',3'-cyclic-nucleotide 2'-phosphodiesterase / 3'-nucleotidase [Roseateles sp. YR242]|uniref:bifunctional 2',3'-cyclic-nucleotide 2'-phosphodiesterase/3'-nucleotidase n=1 Tax=Roseateles sp. YR242 TaxID=1855305 RepID=UPI0008B0C9E3|nr:bifunctional 2',3'-cyclic-nucleotide 2'-phosphodiesterase/3'-nucleotidase [Roseateles sp. YR242]SEL67138.1 2',3'-cyclic-nucleotide 2'-phosphodiesterase / 3'-nucleotidase [Roseateles sp. YR242]
MSGRLSGALATLGLVTLVASTPGLTWAAEVRLRVMQTSDIHMNLLNYDYYQDRESQEFGLSKTITLIHQARAEAPNSLLFDNGDLLQGNPLGDLVARVKPLKAGEVHPAYKVLNLLGVDAANIGNHEFNYGLPFLRQALSGATFPYLNANVMEADGRRHAFTPSVMLEREVTDEQGKTHKLKIGVMGLTPPQIMEWDRQNLAGRVQVRDMVEVARETVPALRRQGADLVVVIAHTGIEKTELPRLSENMAAQLARVPGVDALLLGHAHTEFPGPGFAGYPGADLDKGRLFGVPAVMPGRWGDHLGIVDLRLSDKGGRWHVVDSRASLRPIFDRANRRPLVATDPMPAAVIATEHQATLDHVRSQVAHTDTPIHSYFGQTVDSLAVRLVAQAQLRYAQRAVQGTALDRLPMLSAAAPFKSGGRQGWTQYTDIPAGPIAIKHVADLYVYPNTIKVVKLTGAQVRDWLEMSAGQFRRIDPAGPAQQPLLDTGYPGFNFDMMWGADDGLRYALDLTQPARFDKEGKLANDSHRVVDLSWKGQPLDDQAAFLVVTNNYRAYGGGHFPALAADKVVVDAPDETREALARDLASQPSADEGGLSASWRIRPVPGVKLQFLSGAGAIARLTPATPVRLVKENGDGSALFELAD